MRIAPMVITFWILTFTISLFQTTVPSDTQYEDFFSENATNNGTDAIQALLIHPDEFAQSQLPEEQGGSGGTLFNSIFFWAALTGGIFALAGAVMRSDMILLGGFLSVLVSLIITPVTVIYSWLTDELSQIMCPELSLAPGSGFCAPSLFITSLLLGTAVFMYVMAIFEWWTSRPLTR